MNNNIDYSYLGIEGLTGDRPTKVTNMSRTIVSYVIQELNGLRREFAPGSSKTISMHELYTLWGSPGGEQLIYEALYIEDNDIKKALGLPTKEEVPEFEWAREDALKVLSKGTEDEILDALEFGPFYIAEWFKEDIIKIKNIDRRRFVGELFHLDVEKMEENLKWAAEDPNAQGYREILGLEDASGQGRQRRAKSSAVDTGGSLGNAPTVQQRRSRRANN